MADPLILTAAFDDASAQVFQRLRDRHFPPRLNIVPAHLTLFHALPGDRHADILTSIGGVGEAHLPFTTGPLRNLGRGVAIEIRCPALAPLRAALATQWADHLAAQDRQEFRAHVTIQNKVTPGEARATLDGLGDSVSDIAGQVIGLDLWWYRAGPWEPAGRVRWT